MVWVVWEVLGGFQEKANCPLDLKDPLNLTHYLTLQLAAGKKKSQIKWAILQMVANLIILGGIVNAKHIKTGGGKGVKNPEKLLM